MDLFPAIDLLEGRCVRLRRGELEDVTVYDPDPVGRAAAFAEAGARWIHVVDLDGALQTGRDNRAVVQDIVSAVDVAVQTGGGLRDAAAVQTMLDTGAGRVVLGTAALGDRALVEWLCGRFPGRIAAAVDARDGEVTVAGWTRGSGVQVEELGMQLAEAGVAALLSTDVGRDGMLTGPDIAGLTRLLGAVDVAVLASGGVSSLDDLRALAGIDAGGLHLAGAVVGKAIYEGHFTVAEAIGALA